MGNAATVRLVPPDRRPPVVDPPTEPSGPTRPSPVDQGLDVDDVRMLLRELRLRRQLRAHD